MSEIQEGSGGQNASGRRCARLVKRAQRERWGIPRALRRPLIERLSEIVRDPMTEPQEMISAARTILSASKINLDNISAALKVEDYTDLERRITALEQQDKEREISGAR
jgi:hypothetical protein